MTKERKEQIKEAAEVEQLIFALEVVESLRKEQKYLSTEEMLNMTAVFKFAFIKGASWNEEAPPSTK